MINEVITEAEEKFERSRKAAGFFLGPAVFIALYFMPLGGLDAKAHALSAIMGLVLVFWLTEAIPIPVTALMGPLLCILFDVAPAKEVFVPFANPIVFLFIGSFILAEAMMFHGLDKRFALAIFSIRALQKSPSRMLFALGATVAVISMWMSNTATTAMMFPIALGILHAMRDAGTGSGNPDTGFREYSAVLMLMVAYGASVGGIATPIGTPPNLIGIGMIKSYTGVTITFFEWMAFALPITAVMFIVLFFLLCRSGRGHQMRLESRAVESFVAEARHQLGKWKRAEINTALCFGVAVALWILPSVSALVVGKEAAFTKLLASRLDEGVVALLAASLLFFLPISLKRLEFTLTWKRAVKIDWGTILLFGGGLSLGGLMFSTGLASHIGKNLAGISGADSLWSITALSTALAIVLSETTSNTASANMVIPVSIAIAQGMGVAPLPPALGACLGASFGFMLPVSTPPNAIVYGSGLVPILTMARKGILFDIGGFVIILVGVMTLSRLMGWS